MCCGVGSEMIQKEMGPWSRHSDVRHVVFLSLFRPDNSIAAATRKDSCSKLYNISTAEATGFPIVSSILFAATSQLLPIR